MRLNKKIRGLRNRLGLTQKEFSKILGVRRNTVTRWETGTLIPNPGNMELLWELVNKVEELPKEKLPKKSSYEKALVAGGVAFGLYVLLRAIYGDRDE